MTSYAKLPTSEPSHPTLPDLEASSSEVRAYITNILNFKVDSSTAQHYASKWTIGTGRELRKYPLKMYCDIFEDPQVGWSICKSVRVSMKVEENEKNPPLDWEKRLPFIAVVIVLELLATALCWWNINLIGISAIGWGGGISLIVWLVMDAYRPDPESTVEAELNVAYKAMKQEQ